jgi:hypothetical protein
MDVKLLREGLFVRWIANRHFKKWDVYGKVVEVSENSFKVLTFDDFKTHELDKDGSSLENEISVANRGDVISHLEIQSQNLDDLIFEVESKYRKDMMQIKADISSINTCLDHLKNEK